MSTGSNMNYIVSGLERSGTSLMMQVLEAANVPVIYDNERSPDENNPRGYYELYGGNIIGQLANGLALTPFEGAFIKITSWGLQYLPEGDYKIIYMMRDYDEIILSSQKMGDNSSSRHLLLSIDNFILGLLDKRNIEYLKVNYNELIERSSKTIANVGEFLGRDISKGMDATDKSLYRNRIKEEVEKRLKSLGYMKG